MRAARRGAHATAGVHAGYDDSFGKQIIDPRSKLAVPSSDTSMTHSANWAELLTQMRMAIRQREEKNFST